ncbi:MAG: hypothetical protein KDD64_00355 [Bdellovibrionales bacterium]|nr:hypothetical protein [Bdellovibrionales bacterium]
MNPTQETTDKRSDLLRQDTLSEALDRVLDAVKRGVRILLLNGQELFGVLLTRINSIAILRRKESPPSHLRQRKIRTLEGDIFFLRIGTLFLVVWTTLMTFTALVAAFGTQDLAEEMSALKVLVRKQALVGKAPETSLSPPLEKQHENEEQIRLVTYAMLRTQAEIRIVRKHQLSILSYLAGQNVNGLLKDIRMEESLRYRQEADSLSHVLSTTEKDFLVALDKLRDQLGVPELTFEEGSLARGNLEKETSQVQADEIQFQEARVSSQDHQIALEQLLLEQE